MIRAIDTEPVLRKDDYPHGLSLKQVLPDDINNVLDGDTSVKHGRSIRGGWIQHDQHPGDYLKIFDRLNPKIAYPTRFGRENFFIDDIFRRDDIVVLKLRREFDRQYYQVTRRSFLNAYRLEVGSCVAALLACVSLSVVVAANIHGLKRNNNYTAYQTALFNQYEENLSRRLKLAKEKEIILNKNEFSLEDVLRLEAIEEELKQLNEDLNRLSEQGRRAAQDFYSSK